MLKLPSVRETFMMSSPAVRRLPGRPEDFSATLFHALGIDPAVRLSPDGFTRPASTGTPLTALF